MRHLLAPACWESPWIKGFSLKSLIASKLQGGLSWRLTARMGGGTGLWCWGLWLLLGLGKGVGKHLGQRLGFKCCLWQVVGLILTEQSQIYGCAILLQFLGCAAKAGVILLEAERHDSMLKTVSYLWVGAVGFRAPQWHLAAALCVSACVSVSTAVSGGKVRACNS